MKKGRRCVSASVVRATDERWAGPTTFSQVSVEANV